MPADCCIEGLSGSADGSSWKDTVSGVCWLEMMGTCCPGSTMVIWDPALPAFRA